MRHTARLVDDAEAVAAAGHGGAKTKGRPTSSAAMDGGGGCAGMMTGGIRRADVLAAHRDRLAGDEQRHGR